MGAGKFMRKDLAVNNPFKNTRLFLYLSLSLLCIFCGASKGCMGELDERYPYTVIEDKDTDLVAFGGSDIQDLRNIASCVSNVTVYCRPPTARWDDGWNLPRIQHFRRVASFDDTEHFVDIMKRLAWRREDANKESDPFKEKLPIYYVVFYYKEKGHYMIFFVKFNNIPEGYISSWSGHHSIWTNKEMFKWLNALDSAGGAADYGEKHDGE